MRYLMIAIALVAIALTANEAQAARRIFSGNGQTVSRGEGPFSRLMEMERRKNAALREMFRR